MSGETSGLFRAVVQFIDAEGRPLAGDSWLARVFDSDCLADDRLGQSQLDDQGRASFLIPVADIKSLDSPGERMPDLYFRLFMDGREVFRSQVIEDVDFESLDRVSGDPANLTQEFGPYVVSLDRSA